MKTLLLNFLDCIVAGTSSFVFFQTIIDKKNARLPYYCILFIYILGFILSYLLTSVLNGDTSVYAATIRLIISCTLLFLQGFLFYTNNRTRLLLSISYYALVVTFESFSYYIITSIFSYTAKENVMDVFVFSSISFATSLLIFTFSMIIHIVWRTKRKINSFSYTLILLVIPILSVVFIMSKPILYLNINMPQTYFIIAAFVLFINLMNYIMLYNVLQNEDLRFQLTVQKEQIEFQRNKYEQLGAAYKNIRSFMHDTKKHLFYIEKCVNEKKYDDIIPYSKDIMHDLESRYCTINTGNLVVDAFVSNLLLQTKSHDITLHTNLRFDNNTVPTNDYHLTIILGNLLDNALKACKDQLNPEITVAVRTVENTFTVHVANTYVITDPANAPDDFEDVDFIHGYGLKNVKNSAEACGGFCIIQHRDDVYSATVIIPLSDKAKMRP